MPHVYEVDVSDGRNIQKYDVTVSDDDHHSNWKDVKEFFAFLANFMNVAESAVRTAKWIRKK
jgi:hypothetical protein